MPNREIVAQFVATVKAGQYVEAIESFYADDASMQENQSPPRVGRARLAGHEREALTHFKSIRTVVGEVLAQEGDRVVIHWLFELTDTAGKMRTLDEIAVQQWQADKILREQFYYDPAQVSS